MKLRILLVVLLMAFVASSAQAGKRTRKASKIIDKYVAAIGGERRVVALTSLKCTGYMQQQGMKLNFVLYRARPNKTRMEAQFGARRLIQAYDGHDTWWTNPFAGAAKPERLPDGLKQSVLRWADFDGPLVRYARKGHHAEYVAETTLESGRTAHKIKLILSDGDVWHCYIDADTYLEVLRTYEVTFQGRTRVVVTRFLDYVEVAGVLLPREVESEAVDGTQFRMVFTDYEPDADFDVDIFHMPTATEQGRRATKSQTRPASR